MTSILQTTEIESICSLISQKHAIVSQIVPNAGTSNVFALLNFFNTVCAMLNGHKACNIEKQKNIVE
jgi:hypothetical protein